MARFFNTLGGYVQRLARFMGSIFRDHGTAAGLVILGILTVVALIAVVVGIGVFLGACVAVGLAVLSLVPAFQGAAGVPVSWLWPQTLAVAVLALVVAIPVAIFAVARRLVTGGPRYYREDRSEEGQQSTGSAQQSARPPRMVPRHRAQARRAVMGTVIGLVGFTLVLGAVYRLTPGTSVLLPVILGFLFLAGIAFWYAGWRLPLALTVLAAITAALLTVAQRPELEGTWDKMGSAIASQTGPASRGVSWVTCGIEETPGGVTHRTGSVSGTEGTFLWTASNKEGTVVSTPEMWARWPGGFTLRVQVQNWDTATIYPSSNPAHAVRVPRQVTWDAYCNEKRDQYPTPALWPHLYPGESAIVVWKMGRPVQVLSTSTWKAQGGTAAIRVRPGQEVRLHFMGWAAGGRLPGGVQIAFQASES